MRLESILASATLKLAVPELSPKKNSGQLRGDIPHSLAISIIRLSLTSRAERSEEKITVVVDELQMCHRWRRSNNSRELCMRNKAKANGQSPIFQPHLPQWIQVPVLFLQSN